MDRQTMDAQNGLTLEKGEMWLQEEKRLGLTMTGVGSDGIVTVE